MIDDQATTITEIIIRRYQTPIPDSFRIYIAQGGLEAVTVNGVKIDFGITDDIAVLNAAAGLLDAIGKIVENKDDNAPTVQASPS